MIAHQHVFVLICKHGLRMRVFRCYFCACVYFAAIVENCRISLLF